MAFSHSSVETIGRTFGVEAEGRMPYPWIMFVIRYFVEVNDRFGNRTKDATEERVIVQGTANAKAIKKMLYRDCEVMAKGQSVRAFTVAADGNIRGKVTLAAVVQVADRPKIQKDPQ